MKDETIAIHAGYKTDPTTKSVAVPLGNDKRSAASTRVNPFSLKIAS